MIIKTKFNLNDLVYTVDESMSKIKQYKVLFIEVSASTQSKIIGVSYKLGDVWDEQPYVICERNERGVFATFEEVINAFTKSLIKQ